MTGAVGRQTAEPRGTIFHKVAWRMMPEMLALRWTKSLPCGRAALPGRPYSDYAPWAAYE